MRKIYKYQLAGIGASIIYLPLLARIIDFNWQGTKLYFWALVDDGPLEHRRLYVVATGEDLPQGLLQYVRSAHGNGLVLHLFEDLNKD